MENFLLKQNREFFDFVVCFHDRDWSKFKKQMRNKKRWNPSPFWLRKNMKRPKLVRSLFLFFCLLSKRKINFKNETCSFLDFGINQLTRSLIQLIQEKKSKFQNCYFTFLALFIINIITWLKICPKSQLKSLIWSAFHGVFGKM